MALIGYGRVSTADQHLDIQEKQLLTAGCERIYMEKLSGTLASRPELDRALDHLRAGDILVITRLDRLGRSVKNLIDISERLRQGDIALRVVEQGIDSTTSEGRMFFHMLAAVAEFEHDLIVARTKDGLEAARARGMKGGRKPKLTQTGIQQARAMYDAVDERGKRLHTVQAIADTLRVSRGVIYRVLSEDVVA
ncbi:recombinase family protein [Subtercola vilae]|uniref:Recombinase family protein n=1 Tax=Subtercola vilae TaxID=2056433 RepID=A0A4V4RF79_9MICO|nr:recombinase family protein [Subtercola vilae]TIH34964.1 recombinase family protein [Subtercola vilae]